jgi:hypothetical protein
MHTPSTPVGLQQRPPCPSCIPTSDPPACVPPSALLLLLSCQALDRWEERLDSLFEGVPYDILDAALTDTIAQFPVDIQVRGWGPREGVRVGVCMALGCSVYIWGGGLWVCMALGCSVYIGGGRIVGGGGGVTPLPCFPWGVCSEGAGPLPNPPLHARQPGCMWGLCRPPSTTPPASHMFHPSPVPPHLPPPPTHTALPRHGGRHAHGPGQAALPDL